MNIPKKRYLFFLRHYNDIDNISPIIYCFLKADTGHRAEVILYDENYSGENDANLAHLSHFFPDQFSWFWLGECFGLRFAASYNAAFLRRQCATLIKRVLKLLPVARFKLLDLSAQSSKYQNSNDQKPTSTVKKLPSWQPLYSLADIRSGRFSRSKVSAVLRRILNKGRKADLIIFDIVRSHYVRGLLEALRQVDAKSIICLPVSPLINYNVLREYDFGSPSSAEFHNRNNYQGFDAIAYVDSLYPSFYQNFIQRMGIANGMPTQIRSIGSLRYYPEWIEQRHSYLPRNQELPAKSTQNPSQKRVLILLSRLKTNVNLEELRTTLNWIQKSHLFDIRVKGHTRANKHDHHLQIANGLSSNHLDTSQLIDWADVIVFWGTSAAIEGYAKSKIMVCIPYVSSNLNLYAYYDAGFIARCRDELLLFLTEFARTGIANPYNYDGIERMRLEVVRANCKDWDEHVSYILEFLSEQEDDYSRDMMQTV